MNKRWIVLLGNFENAKKLYDGNNKNAAEKILKANKDAELFECLYDEREILNLN